MTITLENFLDTLKSKELPPGMSSLLTAVWHGLRGEWDDAHNIAQDDDSTDAAWIHGWLHRIEGDNSNANYWYRQAKRPSASGDTQEEGCKIAEHLLQQS